MSLQDLLKQAQGGSPGAGGFSGIGTSGLLKDSKPVNEKQRQALRDQEAFEFEIEASKSFFDPIPRAVNKVASFFTDAYKGTRDIYAAAPGKFSETIKQGAEEYQRREPLSLAKVGFRTSADFAEVVFAPLSAAVGSILKSSGGQSLVDSFGQKVADKSGITDWKAFQKFAMEHPNAGQDFTRFLNLATLGVEGNAPIKPGSMVSRTSVQATQAVQLAQRVARSVVRPVPKSSGVRKLVVESQTGQAEVPVNGMTATARRAQAYDEFNRQVDEQNRAFFDDNPNPENRYGQYEPYTQPYTIEYGRGRDLNTPVTATPPRGMRYSPISQIPRESASVMPDAPVPSPAEYVPPFRRPSPVADSPSAAEVGPDLGRANLAPLTSEQKSISKMAQGIEARAVADGLVRDLGDLPELARANWEYQGKRAIEIVSEDFEKAKRIAMGMENPPGDVLPEAVFKVVEQVARKNGDIDLITRLGTKSKLLAESRVMGQRIGYQSQFGDSPVKIVKDLAKTREEAALQKNPNLLKEKGDDYRAAKMEVVKKTKSKQSVADFIKEIICKK